MLATIWLVNTVHAQCSCTDPPDILDSGTATNYSLNTSDRLCIVSGTYTGFINSLASGADICVDAGATFQPAGVNNASGTITNYGTATFPSIAFNAGATIDNYGQTTFAQNVSFNGTTTILNKVGGTMDFSFSVQLSNNSSLTNNGEMTFSQNLDTQNGTTLNNTHQIETQEFNPDGVVNNYGLVEAMAVINFNNNSDVTNYCTFISRQGFYNNSSSMQNEGYLIITGATSLWENNQTFVNSADGVIVGVDFRNSSTITGAGNYYFSGNTVNQGPFGNDGGGINFYDAGLPSNIMDQENTTPHASVTKNAFVPPAETDYPSTCSASLPVELASFEVQADGNSAILHWETLSETNNAGFFVEMAHEGAQDFRSMGFLEGAGTTLHPRSYSYRIADLLPDTYRFRLKQIDFDGTFAYSPEVQVAVGGTAPFFVSSFYPNPFRETTSSLVSVPRKALFEVTLYDLWGRLVQVIYRGIPTTGGTQHITIDGHALPSGVYLVRIRGDRFATTRMVTVVR